MRYVLEHVGREDDVEGIVRKGNALSVVLLHGMRRRSLWGARLNVDGRNLAA
jgi:hypothetical protein